jgi:hypothetical protein
MVIMNSSKENTAQHKNLDAHLNYGIAQIND